MKEFAEDVVLFVFFIRLVALFIQKTVYVYTAIGKISLTSPIVINVPTKALLAVETKGSFVQEVGAFE